MSKSSAILQVYTALYTEEGCIQRNICKAIPRKSNRNQNLISITVPVLTKNRHLMWISS